MFAFHIVLGSADDISIFGKHIFKEKTIKNKIKSNILSFLIICLTVFLGELIVGNLWDILFGVQLWNYSELPLNITQYTSIASTLGFGSGAYLIFKFLFTPMLDFIQRKVKYKIAIIVDLTLGVLIILDTVFMIFQMAFLGEARIYWSIHF